MELVAVATSVGQAFVATHQMNIDTTGAVGPFVLAITVMMGILLVLVPRRYALFPIIVLTCYMPMGQALMIAGFHFTMLRILMLFGWARIILRGEICSLTWHQIDRVVLVWAGVKFVAYLLLWQSADALVYALGFTYNALGFYVLFRLLLRNLNDIIAVFKILAVCIAPLAALMVVEKVSGQNPFAILGGEQLVSQVRDGVVRATGPFGHPILAGTFGATLLPFFVALWQQSFRNRFLAIIGLISSLVITIASGSSGPVLAAAASVAALCMWPFRKQMRHVRWAILLLIVGLDLVMKAPVWFVIARIDIFAGDHGYHRAYLIDRAIANLHSWWFVGTKSTATWADTDAGLFDVTNQYLVEGANGGLLTMLLFIWIMVSCFRCIGCCVRRAEADGSHMQFLFWALGAALFAHLVSYMSVSYFDQNVITWYLLLGMISTAMDWVIRNPKRTDLERRLSPNTLPTISDTSPVLAR